MIPIPIISCLAKAALISLAAAAFLPATAARPSFGNETTTQSLLSQQGHGDGLAQQAFVVVRDPLPVSHGMPPHFNVRTAPWQRLRKRQCLENGTNFCFADNEEKSCPDCGVCCSEAGSDWCCLGSESCCSSGNCCAAGTTCCGDVCCKEGETCSAGQCKVPVVTKTTTTTVKTTVTTTSLTMVTVQKIVVETSTVNTVVTTTVTSTDGTQTDITYSTTTVTAAPAKRALATPTAVAKRAVEEWAEEEAACVAEEPATTPAPPESSWGLVRRLLGSLWSNLVYGGEQVRLDRVTTSASPTEPRKCAATTTKAPLRNLRRLAKRQGDGTSTVFVTVTVTSTASTTIEQTSTTTDFSTSVSKTTITQTSTRVVGATATVSTTSIITITAREATTQTITSTSTFLVDPTGVPVDNDPDGDGGDGTDGDNADLNDSGGTKKKKSGLSSSAVIGIGVGAGLVGLVALLAALFFWRRRRKNQPPRAYDFTYNAAPQMTSPTPPSPQKPTLPFVGATPPHHDASYTPTVSEMHSEPTPDPSGGPGAAGAGMAAGGPAAAAAMAARRGHTRNASSTSNPLMASGKPSPDPHRDSHQSWPTNASEMPTETRYELGDEPQPSYQQPPQPPPQPPPPRSHFRAAPHPSTSSISRVTRFAELDGSGQGRMS